jgi:hypothetical protein
MSDFASCASDAKRIAGEVRDTNTPRVRVKRVNESVLALNKKRFIVKTSTFGNNGEIQYGMTAEIFQKNCLSVGCEEKFPLSQDSF